MTPLTTAQFDQSFRRGANHPWYSVEVPVLDPAPPWIGELIHSKSLKAFLLGSTHASFQCTVWGWLSY